MDAPGELAATTRNPRAGVGLAFVIVAATAIRLWPAGDVFGGEGVRVVGDGDAVYHLVRAQRAAAEWPAPPWSDPGLDHPHGALIPWPPLFDEIIATVAVLTPGGSQPEHVARVAAVLPVALSVLTVVLLVALARALIGGTGIAAAFIAAMVPASVHYGFVGLPDQHVAELALWCAALLAYVHAQRRERWKAPALGLGVLLALSFWNWPGSGLSLLVLAAHAAVNHAVEPAGPGSARRFERALALGAGVSALLLAASIALFAPAGALARMAIVSVGGLSVVLCAAVAAGAGALFLVPRLRRSPAGAARRGAEVAAAGVLAGAGLLLVPGVVEGVRHGLTAAGAANSWYRSIAEFKVAVGSGVVPLRDELLQLVAFYGLTLVAVPFAFAAGWREWRARPERRDRLLVLAVWGGAFLLAALARMRFMLYLSAPLGIACALWLERLSRRAGRWSPAVVAAGALVLVAPAALYYPKPGPATEPRLAEAASWIARAAPADPAARGVLAPWSDGHALRAAGLPVVASPFGTDVSARSLRDEATFFCSPSADEARAIAQERRIGFVIVHKPLSSVASVQDYRAQARLPAPVTATSSWSRGVELEPGPEFSRTMMARLFYGDGRAPRGVDEPSVGWARILREELPPEPSGTPDLQQVKTFGVVPGAVIRVRGAAPGTRVLAGAEVATNAGRTFTWTTYGVADGEGEAELRVPYASGANGECSATPCVITDGARATTVFLAEEDVTTGATLAVDLSGAPSTR